MFKLYWQKFILPYWPLVLMALLCFIISSLAGLSTLMMTDRVIYLVNGRIVETGTHGDLIEQNGLYAKAVLNKKVGI